MSADLFSYRNTDPIASREAAREVAPGNADLVKTIRKTLEAAGIPLRHQDISAQIMRTTDRWTDATIRSACARSGLVAVGTTVINGRRFTLWTLDG